MKEYPKYFISAKKDEWNFHLFVKLTGPKTGVCWNKIGHKFEKANRGWINRLPSFLKEKIILEVKEEEIALL